MTYALKAAEELAKDGIDATVIACPFLNRIDGAWFAEKLKGARLLVTIDNHYVNGGFGDQLLSALARAGASLPPRVLRLGLDDVPSSGQPAEVLRHHGLDCASLEDRVREELKA
jgi:transketolase